MGNQFSRPGVGHWADAVAAVWDSSSRAPFTFAKSVGTTSENPSVTDRNAEAKKSDKPGPVTKQASPASLKRLDASMTGVLVRSTDAEDGAKSTASEAAQHLLPSPVAPVKTPSEEGRAPTMVCYIIPVDVVIDDEQYMLPIILQMRLRPMHRLL